MKRTAILVALTLASLAACAHSEIIPVNGPDGQVGWYAITCKKNQANCFEAAGDACPAGYLTAESQGQSGVAVSGAVTPNGAFGAVHPTYRGDMLIKCKPTVVAMMEPAPVVVVQTPAPQVVVEPPQP